MRAYQFGWVVEKGDASAPMYAVLAGGIFRWAFPGDHATALRLARKEDADAIAELMEDADRVAEHEWDVEG